MTEDTFKLSDALRIDPDRVRALGIELLRLANTETWVSEVVKKYIAGCDPDVIMRGILIERYLYNFEVVCRAHVASEHEEEDE